MLERDIVAEVAGSVLAGNVCMSFHHVEL